MVCLFFAAFEQVLLENKTEQNVTADSTGINLKGNIFRLDPIFMNFNGKYQRNAFQKCPFIDFWNMFFANANHNEKINFN